MKKRLDVLLVEQGYAASREKAKAVIQSGNVYVDGEREDRPGTFFPAEGLRLEVRGNELRYVSRGGLKLEKAVEKWPLPLEGGVCMDIGASTGGFTDCMLQNGARKVYSVDVGRGQLAGKLRDDRRVVCMEQTNFRYLAREEIGDDLDFAGADVSFISLTKILIPARNLLKCGGEMVCLVKPQFEAGREKVGKNGVVRDGGIHREVVCRMVDYADAVGFRVVDLDYSPIRGPEGNIEYLLYLRKEREPGPEVRELTEKDAEERLRQLSLRRAGLSSAPEWTSRIRRTVEQSHAELAGPRAQEAQAGPGGPDAAGPGLCGPAGRGAGAPSAGEEGEG